MSGVKLEGNALGTGTFTIKSPNSNTDRTFDLPDNSGTLLNNNSDITSQVKTAINASGAAPVYACRAWVNFNGTGTVAIRASGNVTSITDNGVGDYTVNFTNAMPDANYSPAVSASANYGIDWPCTAINTKTASATEEAPTTTTFRLQCTNDNGSVYDAKYVTAVVFR